MLGVLDAAWPAAAVATTILVTHFAVVERSLTPVTSLAILGVVGLGFALWLSPRTVRTDGGRVFLLAFLVNAAVTVVLYQLLQEYHGVPYFAGGTDDLFYDRLGRDFWRTGILTPREAADASVGVSKYYGYPLTVAWSYLLVDPIGGAHGAVPRYLNVMGGGLLAVLVLRLGLRLGYSREVAKLSAYFVAVYPFLGFHHALVLRDTLTALFITGATVAFIEAWGRRKVWPQVPLLIALLLVLQTYRDSSAYLLVVSLGVAFLFSPQEEERRGVRLMVAGLLLLGLAAAGPLLFDLAQYAYRYQGVYTAVSAGTSGPGSAAMSLLDLPFPLNLLARIPLGLMWPLPVLRGDPADLYRNIGALVWYPLLPFIIVGWVRAFAEPRRRPVAVIALFLFLGVALVTLHYRHMVQYVPFLILFGIGGYRETPGSRTPAAALSFLAAATAVGMYTSLKFG